MSLLRPWAEGMERESREWHLTCPCGASASIWELGEIRWKAKGTPRRLLRCGHCGERTWHRVERRRDGVPPARG